MVFNVIKLNEKNLDGLKKWLESDDSSHQFQTCPFEGLWKCRETCFKIFYHGNIPKSFSYCPCYIVGIEISNIVAKELIKYNEEKTNAADKTL